ncbi:MAG TPA: carbohydrate ABC transporter permease [Candidatus Blautia merdavium]|uniref:Carbohydrate ABC transporter permease n=1 Tax=Candidatus Blautia merdavium TaxID=2838494 RepID=A0A9D2PM63_9FIRM|nr:carbohydrate ABC transporter permease [Candidatus Blautia merdavium]
MNKRKKKISPGSAVFSVFKYLMLTAAAVIAVLPVCVCVLTAFKTTEEYNTTSPLDAPATFLNFENFKIAFQQANMLQGFLNTAIVLVVVLFVSVFIGAMLAYVLNRFKFKGNAVIQNLFMFAALIPGIATQVTVYQIMYSLGLINHLYGYMIVLMGTDIISIYIFLQFFENLSVSLDESAIMDGCTYFGVFFKILFPLLKPAIVTSLVLKGVGVYNEYYMSNLYLQSKELKTISTALYTFTGPYGNQYNYICAGVLITIIPIFILFLVFQKQIYSGMAAGAVKG